MGGSQAYSGCFRDGRAHIRGAQGRDRVLFCEGFRVSLKEGHGDGVGEGGQQEQGVLGGGVEFTVAVFDRAADQPHRIGVAGAPTKVGQHLSGCPVS